MRTEIVAVGVERSHATTGPLEHDVVDDHVGTGAQDGDGRLDVECRRRAIGCDDAEHVFLDRQPRVDIANREDRSVCVAIAAEVGVPAEGEVLGEDRGVGERGLPLTPGGRDHAGLFEHNPLLPERARQCFACEGVHRRERGEVVHELVRPAQQARGPQHRTLDAGGQIVSEVHLRRATQRAVRHADVTATERVVDHLPDFHDLTGIRTALAIDVDAKDHGLVGPVSIGHIRNRGIVGGRDAVAGIVGLVEWAIVDSHAAPGHEAPVDRGLGLKERRPLVEYEREQVALPLDIVRGRRHVPGDQAVGDRVP